MSDTSQAQKKKKDGFLCPFPPQSFFYHGLPKRLAAGSGSQCKLGKITSHVLRQQMSKPTIYKVPIKWQALSKELYLYYLDPHPTLKRYILKSRVLPLKCRSAAGMPGLLFL